jgi:hypothetical protein
MKNFSFTLYTLLFYETSCWSNPQYRGAMNFENPKIRKSENPKIRK